MDFPFFCYFMTKLSLVNLIKLWLNLKNEKKKKWKKPKPKKQILYLLLTQPKSNRQDLNLGIKSSTFRSKLKDTVGEEVKKSVLA